TAQSPNLAGLDNNGGPTQTMVLLAGSPAINAGSNAFVTAPPFVGPPFTDQRGFPSARVFGGTVDIGAFELVPLGIPLVVDSTADEDDGNYTAGDLTLREALALANAYPGADTISFAPAVFGTPQTITLGLGQLTINSDLTLTGPG